MGLVILSMAGSLAAAQPSAQPETDKLQRIVDHFFSTQNDYQPGDLIVQSQIAEVLKAVRVNGYKLAGEQEETTAEKVVKLGLADDSFLPKEFSTPAGRRFMRKIAMHPGAYSQLDRLSSMARGEKLIRDLIHERGGDTLVEYLTTTQGGKNLGRMLAGARHGSDLNKPTGRIYTADDLLIVLRQVAKR
jgi:hypothetical protein